MKQTPTNTRKTAGIIVTVLTALLVPLVLIFLGIRLLASNTFLEVEYRLPHFPPDEYGFTLEQRLEYSRVCIQYLNSNGDISLLDELTFPDGKSLFNGRELSHMEDVKIVYRPFSFIGLGLTAVLLIMILAATRGLWQREILRGLRTGGLLSFGLVVVISIFAALSFWTFFESFHAIFFSGDSWMFLYSDSLIRLFPMQFWQDVVLYLLGFTGIMGLVFWFLLSPKRKPKAA